MTAVMVVALGALSTSFTLEMQSAYLVEDVEVGGERRHVVTVVRRDEALERGDASMPLFPIPS